MFEFLNITSRGNCSRNVYSNPTIQRFKEKHFISALLGALTITCLCCSLVEPVWFNIESVTCCFTYVGLIPFMHAIPVDYFESQTNSSKCKYKAEKTSYEECIDSNVEMSTQVLSSIMILTILISISAFCLDIVAPKKFPFWKVVKRYSFGYILTVLLVATAMGFIYWVSQDIFNHIKNQGRKNIPTLHIASNLKVTYGLGVYLATAGGCLSVLAVASNLMRHYPTAWEEQNEQLALISDEENDDNCNIIVEAAGPPAYQP